MARKTRIACSGYPLHVVQRGNNRAACFVDDKDRLLYLALVTEFARREQCAVHAYVLMTNHVHILSTGRADGAISRLMKRIGENYVPIFNRKHERTGTLWEGRFHCSVVDTESYLLSCYRYIELNPVRSGMVVAPGDYAWSSHGHNAEGRDCPMIDPHPAFLALGSTWDERRSVYKRHFGSPQDPRELQRIRDAINGNFALGSLEFVRELEERTGRKLAPRRAGRPPKHDDSHAVIPSLDKSPLTPISGVVPN
jgi:putative transposase